MKAILAIDEGTTGTTALLMDEHLRVLAEANEDFQQHFPQPGWVEHDLKDVWSAVQRTIQKVCSAKPDAEIVGVGITNQRETICFWDKKTGEPLARAIVWQDRRTAEFCTQLKSRGLESRFQDSTGLLLDPYFSGTKVHWALEHWSEVRNAHQAGRLAVGTIDSYLIWKLSGHQAHVTEPSNASRTLAFNIKTLTFDRELCHDLEVPHEIWPEVKPSAGLFARTRGVSGIKDGTPISGNLGDQQAALLGQACVNVGEAKCTYGTGAFLLMNTGNKPVKSHSRLLTTVAWQMPGLPTTYALEGSAFIAGAAVQWLRDGLGLIKSAPEIEALAASVPSTDGVVFVPALTGLGAPHWDPHATGLFTGLTRGSTQAHLARAVLEGIALQNTDILDAMEKDLGEKLKSLNVDGGAAANNLLMQMQSDFLGVELRRPKYLETTSLGAVFAAGIGIGLWKNLEEVRKSWQEDRKFKPSLAPQARTHKLDEWKLAVRRTRLHA